MGTCPLFYFWLYMHDLSQIYREKIKEIVAPVIESEDMELVDVECLKMKSRWLVRIYMDKEDGITLDDCSEISNQVSDLLDIHEILPDTYILEVSSPGLDRPLAREKDFIKYRGHNIKVKLKNKLDGEKIIRGNLLDFNDVNGKKILIIDTKEKTYSIPRETIIKATLEYDFS